MSWRIDNHPDGGLQITHLTAPRFTARWTTGEFPISQVRNGAFFWTDEGGTPEDSIHLYDFVWDISYPSSSDINRLMWQAVKVIEQHIMSGA
jgi:hypothetical protein